MRILLATFAVAGCSFEHGALGGASGDPVDDPVPEVDGGEATARVCKYPDPDLRLCIEFEDRQFTPFVHDASAAQMNATAEKLGEYARNGSPAAGMYYESRLHLVETANLDIPKAITMEMWTQVPLGHWATLLGNEGQYAITLEPGRVTCRIGTLAVTSEQTVDDSWAHVACTFDGTKLAVFVNGDTTRCVNQQRDIATNGDKGTRIGAGFTGLVDDVRIYARALAPTEICTHADRTSCISQCGGGGGGGGWGND